MGDIGKYDEEDLFYITDRSAERNNLLQIGVEIQKSKNIVNLRICPSIDIRRNFDLDNPSL